MTCSCYTVIMAKNFNYVIDHYLGYEVEIRITIAVMLLPLILLAYVPNLKYLAPFSMVANGFMAVSLGITFYYLVEKMPAVSERPAVAPIATMPVFFSITIFAIEAIGVVSTFLSIRRVQLLFLPWNSINCGVTQLIDLWLIDRLMMLFLLDIVQ